MGLITSKEIRPVTPLLYTVDGGSTTPNNRYPSIPKDYDIRLLHKLIVSRRLAPFYRGTSEPTVGTDMDMDRSTDSVDCPICFLTYPANINYTRCCDQPICTECFLHIKPSSRTLHTTCPFCIESLFGVIYSWWNLLPVTSFFI
ncbi:hypothetical protein BDF14DRAFT_999311 [Spinellus fusiger]|nr:hypothetical protein BDF14DRAFT_999311 [Spinellus fusiger]